MCIAGALDAAGTRLSALSVRMQAAAAWCVGNVTHMVCVVVVSSLIAITKHTADKGKDDVAFIFCALAAFVAGMFHMVVRKNAVSKHLLVVAVVTVLQFHFYTEDIVISQLFEFLPGGMLLLAELLELSFIHVDWPMPPPASSASAIPLCESPDDQPVLLGSAEDTGENAVPWLHALLRALAADPLFREYYHVITNGLLVCWALLPIKRVGILNMEWHFLGVFVFVWTLFAIHGNRNRVRFKSFNLSDECCKCSVLLYLPRHAHFALSVLVVFDLIGLFSCKKPPDRA